MLDQAFALLHARSGTYSLPVELTKRDASIRWLKRAGLDYGSYTLWELMLRVASDACRQNIYVRSMVWSIGLSLRIYLYSIECSHLALLALSLSLFFSFTFDYVRTKGEKNMKSPRPHPFHALYQFFQRGTAEIFTKTDRLSYSRQTKKWDGERAQLVNATLRFGKLPTRGSKCWCDRMNLILARTQFNKIYDIRLKNYLI